MNTEITKLYENEVENIKTEIKHEAFNTENTENTCDDKNDSFLNKRMMYIALSLMSAEIQTKVLKENGFITERQYSRFSKSIDKLRAKYKDLFGKLSKNVDINIW